MSTPGTDKAPVEKKVWAGTGATLAVSVLIAVLDSLQGNVDLLGQFSPLLQTVLIVFVPPLVTFLSGYLAPHTNRGNSAASPGPDYLH